MSQNMDNQSMDNLRLRNYKDFLLLYNKISESCFSHCVNQLTEKDLSQDESRCVDVCTQKFANVNHKVIQVYMEIQPQIVGRRMEEMAQKAEAAGNLNSNTEQPVSNSQGFTENAAVT